MELTLDEKRILNVLFKDVKGTTRNEMLMALYAMKPRQDGSMDARNMTTMINGLIIKIFHAEQPEMEEVFAQIPFDLTKK